MKSKTVQNYSSDSYIDRMMEEMTSEEGIRKAFEASNRILLADRRKRFGDFDVFCDNLRFLPDSYFYGYGNENFCLRALLKKCEVSSYCEKYGITEEEKAVYRKCYEYFCKYRKERKKIKQFFKEVITGKNQDVVLEIVGGKDEKLLVSCDKLPDFKYGDYNGGIVVESELKPLVKCDKWFEISVNPCYWSYVLSVEYCVRYCISSNSKFLGLGDDVKFSVSKLKEAMDNDQISVEDYVEVELAAIKCLNEEQYKALRF